MSDQPALETFLERLPWLAELGPEQIERLDRSDWHLPSPAALARLHGLGDALGVHLMAYRRNAAPAQDGLCATVAAAPLGAAEFERIRATEIDDPECLVVAYQRPLKRRPGPDASTR